MEIKECAYCIKTIHWTGLTKHTCGLFHEHTRVTDTYHQCDAIPISRCPYKEYQLGNIDKLELNNKLKKILDGELSEVE